MLHFLVVALKGAQTEGVALPDDALLSVIVRILHLVLHSMQYENIKLPNHINQAPFIYTTSVQLDLHTMLHVVSDVKHLVMNETMCPV